MIQKKLHNLFAEFKTSTYITRKTCTTKTWSIGVDFTFSKIEAGSSFIKEKHIFGYTIQLCTFLLFNASTVIVDIS